MSLQIDTSTLALPGNQYVQQVTAKDLIVLHHTAGASESSSVRWWRMTPERIATAFIIGRDGQIYQCFDPKYWASHLGIGGAIERRAIGIELANWGPLRKSGPNYVTYTGQLIHPSNAASYQWRGETYWEIYPEAQIAASIELVRHLVTRFGIDPDVAPAQLGTPDVKRFRAFRGVVAHHHVRADKTDVSPVYPWARLQEAVEVPSVSYHVVQAGDTLYRIAIRYGVPVANLARLNGITDATRIHVGQRLRLR